jgi:hypothetical protein
MTSHNPDGNLKPIAPTRVAEELKRLSNQRGSRAEIMGVLMPLRESGVVDARDMERLVRQLGLV